LKKKCQHVAYSKTPPIHALEAIVVGETTQNTYFQDLEGTVIDETRTDGGLVLHDDGLLHLPRKYSKR
jgi:hypothetical protein